MLKKFKIIGVMGSGKQDHNDLAIPLGRMLAHKKCNLLNGAGKGTMTSVAKSYTDTTPRQGMLIGIIPCDDDTALTPKDGYPNPYIEIPIFTPLPTHIPTPDTQSCLSRNHMNIMSSDAIIALPGTKGTKNEVDIALDMAKPLIGFGSQNLFDGFNTKLQITNDLDKIEKFVDQILQNT